MGDIQSKDGSFPKSPVGESVVKKEKRPKKRASVEPLTSAIEMATLEDSKKAKTPKKKKSEKKQTKRKSSRPSLDPSITNATTDVGSSVDPHLTPLNKKKKKKVKSFSIDASSNFNQQSSTATSLSPVNATKRVLRHPQQVLSPRSSFLFESERRVILSSPQEIATRRDRILKSSKKNRSSLKNLRSTLTSTANNAPHCPASPTLVLGNPTENPHRLYLSESEKSSKPQISPSSVSSPLSNKDKKDSKTRAIVSSGYLTHPVEDVEEDDVDDEEIDWENMSSDENESSGSCGKRRVRSKNEKQLESLEDFVRALQTFNIEDLVDITKELEEKHSGFLESLKESIQDAIDLKKAASDDSDSDVEFVSATTDTLCDGSGIINHHEDGGSNLPEHCDWNSRFQKSISDLKQHGETLSIERMRIYSEISNLAQDFIHCAKTYGRVIISEAETPLQSKTIKPIPIGGFAGGDKYIVNNILFKFAVDSHGIFGDDEPAIKVAGHDLKGLTHLFNLGIQDFYFPLMALVDYLGYRVIAMSVLPINDRTLVYGTSDAGATVHATNNEMNKKMSQAAALLNLKSHRVGQSESDSKILYSAADLEGHAVNSIFYLVDFSRVFPPCKFNESEKHSFLYKLFRPEFVKSYKRPLCSDSYSGFVPSCDAEEHIREIEEASHFLLNQTIAEYAHMLNKLAVSGIEIDDFALKESMHENGINLRYLGRLRHHINHEQLKHRILVEMLARVIKHRLRYLMRQKMKELKLPIEHSCRELVIDYLNLIFGSSPEANVHWNSEFKENLIKNFPNALLDRELETPLKKLLFDSDLCLLFRLVIEMANLQFTPGAKTEFSTNSHSFTYVSPFDITDLEEIGVRVRQMNVVALAQGYVLKNKARLKQGENSQRLCRLAIEKFQQSLSDNLGDKRTLRELADATNILGDLEQSDFYFRRTINCDPTDPNILFKYAVFLEESMKKMDEAEEFYLRTLEQDPHHDHCLQRYADFLESRGFFDKAEEFYIRASEIRQLRHSDTSF